MHRPRTQEAALQMQAAALSDPAAFWADAVELNVGFMRWDMQWAHMAVSKPKDARNVEDPAYFWAQTDNFVRQAAQHGLQDRIMFTLWSTPKWASSLKASGTTADMPMAMKNILGLKIKLVHGYPGTRDLTLAVDRGEADGHCTGWDTLKTSHPDWLTEKKIRLLTQFAVNRHQELPDVPTVLELATTDRQKAVIRSVVNAAEIGTSFITTPNTPPERLAALRMAFNACMKDPAFIADLKKMNFGLNPLSGEAVGALVSDVSMVAEDLLPDLRDAYSVQSSR
jgi:hypothetical protein